MGKWVVLASLIYGFSATNLTNADPDLDAICKYAPDYCGRAVDRNGDALPPKADVSKLCELFSDDIVQAGKDFGVDPRAIAGAVMAENTMNIQLDDEVKTFLASNSISHAGSKSFSIGPGQIHVDTALEVEPMMASMEHRPERSPAEISHALLSPTTAFRYAAALLRQAQDIYKENGFDVSNKPEILTTLCNLGKVKERAALAKNTNTPPRPNYFGFFVEKNLGRIGQTLGWDPVQRPHPPAPEHGGPFLFGNTLGAGITDDFSPRLSLGKFGRPGNVSDRRFTPELSTDPGSAFPLQPLSSGRKIRGLLYARLGND